VKAVADIQERITRCQKLLDRDPNSQIFAALADAYRKRGDLDRAFRICQTGLKTHPDYGSAHIVMAKINLDRGLYDWAEVEVNKAVELDNSSRATELLTSEIYIYRGEFKRATTILRKLQESDPDDKLIKKLLDIALKLPEEQKAMTVAKTEVDDSDSSDNEKAAEVTEPAATSVGIEDILERAMQLPRLQGALFATLEGLIVESEWKCALDLSVCGATFAELYRSLNQELVRVPFGECSTILIESEGRVFYVVTISSGMFLFVGEAAMSMGSLRMNITSLISSYEDR